MKTAAFILSLCAFLTGSSLVARASWNLSLDGDVRVDLIEGENASAYFNSAGISLRKIISDMEGDRLIFFGLVESHDDFSETMIHELYARYKGPMGRWNITTGRFQIPFGLLTGFTASRLLYDNLFVTTDPDADSGLMISGVAGDIDYFIAATQGVGSHGAYEFPGPGNSMGRVGITLGDSGEFTAGLSAMIGRNRHGPGDHIISRQVAAADATILFGRLITRWEVQAGNVDNRPFRAGFAMADFSILPRLDLTAAGKIEIRDRDHTSQGFLGLEYQLPWFTVRGGYIYEDQEEHQTHTFTFQLYRLVSFPF